jgi:hypothetical protein
MIAATDTVNKRVRVATGAMFNEPAVGVRWISRQPA